MGDWKVGALLVVCFVSVCTFLLPHGTSSFDSLCLPPPHSPHTTYTPQLLQQGVPPLQAVSAPEVLLWARCKEVSILLPIVCDFISLDTPCCPSPPPPTHTHP